MDYGAIIMADGSNMMQRSSLYDELSSLEQQLLINLSVFNINQKYLACSITPVFLFFSELQVQLQVSYTPVTSYKTRV
ncbi:hypothetical protein O9G_003055 [Rozella allomycis CSF55]|uniref:Uncharacterized protein n=1 Tax=Rozella allomycis (strain CSF55) TaxID=988480 RepID=A0A075AQ09_ROZAC|nr:hypothetical protein O9G_003055 [Rozella allomycis CSF55]|eukprot:EPZ30820.1 hypothetical protein O9G_003055 [Rozella allomycis CSF55]